jgi:hypothetical protein
MTQKQRDGKACSCQSSWQMPRMTKNSEGRRVCSKCYLPRRRSVGVLSEQDQMAANAELNMPDPTDY